MENNDSWEENKLVGNISEVIVGFLINSLPNWKCVKFGVENHMEDLKKLAREKFNPTTKKFKSMPDFVAFNIETGETFFVEVKYRSNRTEKGRYVFSYKGLEEYKEYWKGTKLIIIYPEEPFFICINLDEIDGKMKKSVKVSHTWRDYWDFTDIKKGIKDIFPELPEETIKKAIEMIPKK